MPKIHHKLHRCIPHSYNVYYFINLTKLTHLNNYCPMSKEQSVKKVIPCISEGKRTKSCAYKPLETTETEFKQECKHCGKVRTVIRRRRA